MKLKITVEGKTYEVDVEVVPDQAESTEEEDFESRIPDGIMKAKPPKDFAPEDRICRSPIAGVVVAILAQPGVTVKKDDPLLTIEAMKMQSTIGSTMDGTVQFVRVEAGQAVKSGQVLVELA
ncbi:MAG TPA: acetyl-CoA carboxylase biotin carboxyl carrier protein subunit [Bryobacteraceae bacterium]|nr:acetyl-CoA carboxylase biotin carboxyl carrier protein subunit [Bryobacteraceae bacterium]